ncbi:MAG: GAF domain-containing protein [Vicinamibacterales bacterium]
MHNRGIRLALAIVFMLATLASAYLIFTTFAASRAALAAQASIDSELDALALAIADLRASQQAYVAAGQGEGYWISRVSGQLASVRTDLSAVASHVRSSEARTRLKAAAAKLEDFEQMDRRTREYARGGQRLLASDLIFADGLETTRAAREEVTAARAAERSEAETVLRAADRSQAIAAAASGAAALLLVFLLAPPVRAPAPVAFRQDSSPADQPSTPDILGLALDVELARLDRGRTAHAPGAVEGPALSRVEGPDMTRAADLCVELARVQEPRQLAALLERTAQVLDAAGVIVWIADPDRRELVPTLTHGYAPAALTRFGTIARDADNATAAAFREGTLKTVAADGPASGAIVAPLVTPSGCVGVMAAEVNAERERDAVTRALARIIAAQIAALLGAPPAATRAPRAAEA